MIDYLVAGRSVVQRDFRTAISYRASFVSQFLGALFSVALFYYVSRLVTVSQFGDPDEYFAYVVVGLIILQLLNSTLQTAPSLLRQEVVAGTFERNVLSPLGPVGSMVASLVYPFLGALVTGSVMLAIASLLFGLPVQWSTAALAIPVGVLGALAFAPFGIALMALVLVFKQAVTGVTWVVAAIAIVSGLYFPTDLLPSWISWTADVQPFTPATELLRSVLVGTPLQDPAWLDVTKVVLFSVVLLPLSVALMHAAVRRAKRAGTIIEY